MFSDVVMGIEKREFEDVLDDVKNAKGVKYDTDLDESDLKDIIQKFKDIYKKEVKEDFPQDPKEQLIQSVTAVFRSWENPRAIIYRRLNDISGDWGTAVNVQSMVFGNMGETSGTGVAFTRNPSTGEKSIFGHKRSRRGCSCRNKNTSTYNKAKRRPSRMLFSIYEYSE
jgi:pyruvate,orthophosphate dikinase